MIGIILAVPKTSKTRGQPCSGNYVARINYCFAPSSIRPIDGVITFIESSLTQLSLPHSDAFVLTLEVMRHLMKWILIDHGSATNLLCLPALLHLGYKLESLHNLRRVLVSFNIS